MSFESTTAPPFTSADPHATFLNSTALDFLLIELVPLARRLSSPHSFSSSSQPLSATTEDASDDALFLRLESLGYKVGQGLVERFSRDRPRMVETLDVIKFVCKDLWMVCWRKQVDNLKTNHRGVYVLTDNSFRPLSKMSTEPGGNGVLRTQPYLWFPCGVLRGALANMGIEATVHAECTELPGAVFKIETAQKAPLV